MQPDSSKNLSGNEHERVNSSTYSSNVSEPVQILETSSRMALLRSVFIKMMLGCLIAAAAVAVIAILIGQMTDLVWRTVGTIVLALIHIFLLFGIVSVSSNSNPKLAKTTNFTINTSIAIATMSFFTSIFLIWSVLDGELAAKLYTTYAVALFLLMHAKTLLDAEVIYDKVRPYVRANFVFMAIVAIMILGVTYAPRELELMDGFYGRLLAAAIIVDVTISVIVAVMYRLYVQKNPELGLKTEARVGGGFSAKVILIILFFIFILLPRMYEIFF